MILDMFETMTAEQAWSKYHWGVSIKEGSTVYRHKVGDTVVWVGELDDECPFICEVEVGPELEGQWGGDTPYNALLFGLVDAVIRIAVDEMWVEPSKQGLKFCCEDVVLATATYAAQTLIYGHERLPELFPHSPEGVLTTFEEIELYHNLVGAAFSYIEFDIDVLGGRLGIELDEE